MTVTSPSSRTEPRSFPLGESLPPNSIHAISVSIPTWDEIVRYMKADPTIHRKLQSDYPRFYQHAIVSKLNNAVLARVGVPGSGRCAVFPSTDGMQRCIEHLRQRVEMEVPIQAVEFCLEQEVSRETRIWSHFYAVLFPEQFKQHVEEFWGCFGDGISSRHAQFCLERLPFMRAMGMDSPLPADAVRHDVMSIPSVPWRHSDRDTKHELKTLIAKWATSSRPGQATIQPHDVFLYPKGMCAIGTLARVLVPRTSSAASEAIVFGWPYGSTPKCVKASGYERFTFYDQGTSEELDELETRLASGTRIACLFCEVPSNPLCATPDLHRIRRLADQYDFVVVCDETIGTFVNVDVLPYVDVVLTSLTKVFSGACNVMGGSLILNPRSRFYEQIHTKLGEDYQDLIYPLDAEVLLENCIDFPLRVQTASRNAVTIANHLRHHPSIATVNYPTMVATASLYERYRRPGGGYGSLISIIFRHPDSAMRFYDQIDLCKGPSFGTNFTLVLPYSQLAHAFELDWAESRGMPKHIIRVSVGLEEEHVLLARFDQALKEVEKLERQ